MGREACNLFLRLMIFLAVRIKEIQHYAALLADTCQMVTGSAMQFNYLPCNTALHCCGNTFFLGFVFLP